MSKKGIGKYFFCGIITTLYKEYFMSQMSFQDEINAMNAEAQQLNEQIMKFNFKLENHQSNYQKALDEAKQKFDTDDFDELCAIAEKRANSNDNKKAEFAQALAKKRQELMDKVRREREITEGNI